METNPKIVSRAEWSAARKAHQAKELALLERNQELCAERRALPWVKIDKTYRFRGPDGDVTLPELFGSKRQLMVYHFMFGPSWSEGCLGCSFMADHFDGALWHLPQRDLAFVAVSRAPLEKLEAYKRRMGWKFAWVSSLESDFNFDFEVSFSAEAIASGLACYDGEPRAVQSEELPGTSVFYKDANGDVFHTYSSFGRSEERLVGAYAFLDLLPKGRDESGPSFDLTDWVRRHDEYEPEPPRPRAQRHSCCGGG
jgi:predicted dithiol-disulfide oxidoreductase (DUF899 family)